MQGPRLKLHNFRVEKFCRNLLSYIKTGHAFDSDYPTCKSLAEINKRLFIVLLKSTVQNDEYEANDISEQL